MGQRIWRKPSIHIDIETGEIINPKELECRLAATFEDYEQKPHGLYRTTINQYFVYGKQKKLF